MSSLSLMAFGIQDLKDAIQNIVGIAAPVIICVGVVALIKDAVSKTPGLSKALARADAGIKKASTGFNNRLQKTSFVGSRQQAKQLREQLRSKKIAAHSARRLGGDGLGGTLARIQAGGVTRAGREFVSQAAADQVRREKREEAARAAIRLKAAGFDGDDDFEGIANTEVGRTYTSAKTGQTRTVTEADRQAAVNELVSQGRVQRLRNLEDPTAPGHVARGANGAPISQLHEMLDDAYRENGGKIKDKAPDLMPSLRASEGKAAFTGMNTEDVAGWHETTVQEAEKYYARLTAAGDPKGASGRSEMINMFAQAIATPSANAKLKLEQLQAVEATYAGPPATVAEQNARNAIRGKILALGGP